MERAGEQRSCRQAASLVPLISTTTTASSTTITTAAKCIPTHYGFLSDITNQLIN